MSTLTTANTDAQGNADAKPLVLDIPLIAFAVIAIGLFIAISFRLLEWWYWEWTKPESFYGHAFFVPVLAGVMFWHLRDKLSAVPKERSYSALLLFLPAVAMLVVANHRALLSLSSPLFIFALITGVAFVVGWKFVRVAAFPFLFLTLMLPLPGTLLNDLTLGIQGASTAGATKILNTIGIHSLRQGNIISMDNYVMNVATACSGFNLLLRLLTFSAAFAYLTDGPALRRIGLFLFSLPLSVAINAIRIAMIGVVGECLGSTAASTFHDYSGLLSLVLCMFVLFSVAKWMGCRTFAGQPIF